MGESKAFLFRAFLPIAPVTTSAFMTRVIQRLLAIDAIFNSWFIFSPAVLAIWHLITTAEWSAMYITLAIFITDLRAKLTHFHFHCALFACDKKDSYLQLNEYSMILQRLHLYLII